MSTNTSGRTDAAIDAYRAVAHAEYTLRKKQRALQEALVDLPEDERPAYFKATEAIENEFSERIDREDLRPRARR